MGLPPWCERRQTKFRSTASVRILGIPAPTIHVGGVVQIPAVAVMWQRR